MLWQTAGILLSLLIGSQGVRTVLLNAFKLACPKRLFKSELPIKTSHGHSSSFTKLEDVENRGSYGLGGP